jgi:hypothetical protein
LCDSSASALPHVPHALGCTELIRNLPMLIAAVFRADLALDLGALGQKKPAAVRKLAAMKPPTRPLRVYQQGHCEMHGCCRINCNVNLIAY